MALMLVIQSLRRKQKRLKMNEVEYDESLTALLVEHGFNHKNISELIPITRFSYLNRSRIISSIDSMKNEFQFKEGCMFALSSGRRNNMFFLYHTIVSSEEIRRRLELIAFL
jgi:urease gamma subunit